ncbi:uncharacterized protein MKK02DRAFT_39738 [Dioszegia hungarica]|uniref:Uncharacterized protein n=1 Tax=Dioszegia hungarica TaxID=4972 RepID=A0AA38HFL9_9TREE|nr:uncharacterized protein MKK02DRAFT_39738 [Dioszegia hungarica]KAI9639441.1 hypothetical protein MKK02DRAFT_39738 [Dioszegia hungarica]
MPGAGDEDYDRATELAALADVLINAAAGAPGAGCYVSSIVAIRYDDTEQVLSFELDSERRWANEARPIISASSELSCDMTAAQMFHLRSYLGSAIGFDQRIHLMDVLGRLDLDSLSPGLESDGSTRHSVTVKMPCPWSVNPPVASPASNDERRAEPDTQPHRLWLLQQELEPPTALEAIADGWPEVTEIGDGAGQARAYILDPFCTDADVPDWGDADQGTGRNETENGQPRQHEGNTEGDEAADLPSRCIADECRESWAKELGYLRRR